MMVACAVAGLIWMRARTVTLPRLKGPAMAGTRMLSPSGAPW